MRLSTIVACLLLLSPSRALACIEHAAEQTGWLHEAPSASRYFAGAGAEESSMVGLSLLGLASMALVFVAFRALFRADGRSRIRPDESGPGTELQASPPLVWPGDAWIRLDPGHERPEPAGARRSFPAPSRSVSLLGIPSSSGGDRGTCLAGRGGTFQGRVARPG